MVSSDLYYQQFQTLQTAKYLYGVVNCKGLDQVNDIALHDQDLPTNCDSLVTILLPQIHTCTYVVCR